MGKLAEAFVEITTKDGLGPGLSGAKSKLEGFVSHGRSIMDAFAQVAGGGMIRKFFVDAMSKGSDLTETMSKVGQVFGRSTSSVTAMAQDLADRFGSVKTTTLDAAANLGMIAQGAGLSELASAGLANQLVRLADDASSFYNVPLDVALEKIRSGLVGESEPLRQFGVMLSDAAVKSKAAEMGLGGAKRELTESEKVMARVAIITQQLAKVQGDHARTLPGYANQIKKLSGEWENVQAKVGQSLAGAGAGLIASARGEGKASMADQLIAGLFGTGNIIGVTGITKGSPIDRLFGDAIRAADERVERQANELAGVVTGFDLSKESHETGYAAWRRQDMESIFARRAELSRRLIAEDQAKRDAEFEAKKYTGFAPAGIMGSLFGNDPLWMLKSGVMEGMMRPGAFATPEWSGSHIMGGGGDFIKAAQEQILAKDNVPAKQLEELRKIREAVEKETKGPAKQGGVVLKGRES